MKTRLTFFSALVASVMIAGCDSKHSGGPGHPSSAGTATPSVTPARQTSFAEVTSQLDPGGTVYGYLATDQWLAGLSTNITELKGLVLGLPDVSSADAKNIGLVADFFANAVGKSGIENLNGVGISGVQLTPELHRTKFILNHGQGRGDGLLWNIFGKQPHALAGLDLLTTNTAVAAFGDTDFAALWSAIEKGLGESGVPELERGIAKWPAEFEKGTKLSWPAFLASLGGEAGFVLTLDEAHRISLPVDKQSLEIPAPGLLLAIKVNNDLLFDRLSEELKKNEKTKFTDEGGVKMYAMPLPIPLPLELQITLARAGEYLFVATAPTLVQDALAVRAGKLPGVKQTADFQALQKFAPSTGNSFSYVDRRFSATIIAVQKQILSGNAKMPPKQMELLEKLFLSRGPNYGFSVGSHTATGWQSVSVGNQDSSAAVLAAPVAGVAVGAAMVLPALAKAKEKAQSINCVNNLKQVNLALRIWATDHGDKFPFQVSRSQGGTLELCQPDGEGYDRNAAQHFQVMANELNTPRLLICPADKSKQAADSFKNLESWNVSYQLRTSPQVNDTNPQEVILYCPIHHHTGLVDGSVQQGKRTSKSGF